jgi:hypothetical protein
MHTKILQRCGWVLIVVGALDIAYMIWCIANQIAYSSSFNIFALVGGILLVRGGLKAARWVAALSTFMLAACVIGLLLMPFIYPFGYWLAVTRHGTGMVVGLVIAAALLTLLAWVRQQVMHPEVRQAQLAAGLPPPRIKVPFALGVALPVLLVSLLRFMFRGDSAHEAIRRAEQQLGGNYHYVVTNMQVSSNMKEKSVFAVVTAYNDTEIKSIQVRWKE